jgi:hypothetical protein
MTRRIAMWSGPRNISTAMMRAWENRQDCAVEDEPFYGYYLHKTGIDHPGADEVIADQGTDWQAIVERCIHNSPGNKPLFYQKHMTLHLLPEIDRTFLSSLTNCFLIREPEYVVSSYAAVRQNVTLEDIGFVQQAELFEYVKNISVETPLVIDSRDFLKNPRNMLTAICEKLHVDFDENMLKWPEGPRSSDGVWAKYWYESVWNSTGFTVYRQKPVKLDKQNKAISEQAQVYYDLLFEHRLQV